MSRGQKAGHQESRLEFRPFIDDLHAQRHRGLITRNGTNTASGEKIIAHPWFQETFPVTDKPIDGCSTLDTLFFSVAHCRRCKLTPFVSNRDCTSTKSCLFYGK